MNNNIWKFTKIFAVLITFSVGILVGAIYFSPHLNKDRATEQYLAGIEDQYMNDTYGGTTPEETLALFIDALEKGDIELASKYFLPEDRNKIQNNLVQAIRDGSLDDVIYRIKKLEFVKIENESALFVISNEDNIVQFQVMIGKNKSGIWKIIDM